MKAAVTRCLVFVILASSWSCDQREVQSYFSSHSPPNTPAATPVIDALMSHYGDFIYAIRNDTLFWRDGTFLIYDDGRQKAENELLKYPDVEDMFQYNYILLNDHPNLEEHNNAGRIRQEAFFRKIYGNSKEEVRKNLNNITFLGQKIAVTKINSVDKKLLLISEELEQLLVEYPDYGPFLERIGGTFNWRLISGTTRLSTHSFGIAIDINVNNSNYWKWDSQVRKAARIRDTVNHKILEEDIHASTYKNSIPLEIVEIFEKYGFIWGGSWKHFDTMHFEYRPELIELAEPVSL